MLEALKGFPENTVAFAARGRLTQSDYRTVLVPAVETALKTHKKLRVYFEIGSDFAGIDPSAVWEDFKIGFRHWLRWEMVSDLARLIVHMATVIEPETEDEHGGLERGSRPPAKGSDLMPRYERAFSGAFWATVWARLGGY